MQHLQRTPEESVKHRSTTRGKKRLEVYIPRGRNRLKEQPDELRTRYEQADGANRAKTDFINILSHELRKPIHVIVGCGDLLLNGAWGTLQESQKAILLKMKQNAYYLFDVMNDLMELTRLDKDRVGARYEEIDVRRLLEEVAWMRSFMPKAEGVVLKLKIPPGLPTLFSDRDKLRIILRNLLGNAMEFTKKGQITIGARFNPKEEMMELRVCDTGIGIGEKDRQRIFDAFWQGDNSHTHPFSGVGLGLYIVKRLTDHIGAKIEVESEKGKGSRFRLRIPTKHD
jgi:signal transduction histidine kinase